jgi:membrane protein implicated in regulation of membrane protease activity
MHHILTLMPLLALMLFIFLPWPLALALYIPLVSVSLFAHWKGMQAQRLPPRTGTGTMIGDRAEVVSSYDDEAEVHYRGETWHAVSSQPLQRGQRVTIQDVEGLTLHVAPPAKAPEDSLDE